MRQNSPLEWLHLENRHSQVFARGSKISGHTSASQPRRFVFTATSMQWMPSGTPWPGHNFHILHSCRGRMWDWLVVKHRDRSWVIKLRSISLSSFIKSKLSSQPFDLTNNRLWCKCTNTFTIGCYFMLIIINHLSVFDRSLPSYCMS